LRPEIYHFSQKDIPQCDIVQKKNLPTEGISSSDTKMMLVNKKRIESNDEGNIVPAKKKRRRETTPTKEPWDSMTKEHLWWELKSTLKLKEKLQKPHLDTGVELEEAKKDNEKLRESLRKKVAEVHHLEIKLKAEKLHVLELELNEVKSKNYSFFKQKELEKERDYFKDRFDREIELKEVFVGLFEESKTQMEMFSGCDHETHNRNDNTLTHVLLES
jgi:hypothetical protein